MQLNCLFVLEEILLIRVFIFFKSLNGRRDVMGQPSRREIYPGHLVVASCSMRGSWGKTEVVREACGAGDVYLTFIFLLCNPLNVLLRPWGKPAACVDQKEQKRETIRNNQDGFREQRHTPRESQESERGNRCTDGLSDMAYSGKGDL